VAAWRTLGSLGSRQSGDSCNTDQVEEADSEEEGRTDDEEGEEIAWEWRQDDTSSSDDDGDDEQQDGDAATPTSSGDSSGIGDIPSSNSGDQSVTSVTGGAAGGSANSKSLA